MPLALVGPFNNGWWVDLSVSNARPQYHQELNFRGLGNKAPVVMVLILDVILIVIEEVARRWWWN